MQFDELGPYRLGKQLGRGGMGAVYAAIDAETGAEAAVKVLAPQLAAEEGFRVRFEAEIESLKKLRHPNIVRLFGYGEQAGTLFYAMELVHGTSLEDELRRGRRFDWREVTQIAIRVCRALKHAHDHGVIHRDIKPANLLIASDGEVKLSDFGIARLFGNTRLTSDGGVLGTAEYMAPEQAAGKLVTDRCDQYSLGLVLYTLLAGRPPFRADTVVEMLQMQRYSEPELIGRVAPATPVELARIVHQLLEKDPQKRFPNAAIVARSLEAMERGLSVVSEDRGDELAITSPEAAEPATPGPLAPTLSADEFSRAGARRTPPPIPAPATEPTMAYERRGKKSAAAPPPVSEDTAMAADRFTKVEERREERSLGAALAALMSPQTWALLAALCLVIAAGWYFMRPPRADALFARIDAAAASGDPDELKNVRGDIDAFLQHFPDDPRATRVQALADDADQSNPIQRAYAEALRYSLVSPEQGLAKFTALVDAYDDGADSSETARHYVRLAKVQKGRLEKRVDRYVEEGRKLIEARLAKADKLAGDDPAAAHKIYLGIIELYRDKPWADDLVRRAQGALPESAKQQAAN